MQFQKLRPLIRLLMIVGGFWSTSALADPSAASSCHVGAYRLAAGTDIDIGPGEGEKLRWRRKDGVTGELTPGADGNWTSSLGWTGKPDGVHVSFPKGNCDRILFNGDAGMRIPLGVTDTRFGAEGAELAGRLVMPGGSGPVPIVVLIHGSEHSSALDSYSLQRMLPSSGIGVFVYDKRGTGASGGRYTQDYLTLATDAIAAMHEARRLAGARAGSIGYQGGSQGGWVAPLAAQIEPVDFVIVGFGLAVPPIEEERSAIALDMTRHGYGPDVVAKALQLADAIGTIMNSDFQSGYEEFAAVRARYAGEPWFKYIHGDVAWIFLQKTPEELRKIGPDAFAGIPLHYDPMPVLRNLKTPQLWLLGEDDVDAPSAETARRLRGLAAGGHPISVVVYPHAEHGLYEYETQPDGTRLSTRQPADYFSRMRDFIFKQSGRRPAGQPH